MQASPNQARKKLLMAAAIFMLPVIAIGWIIYSFFHKPLKQAPVSGGASAFNAQLPAPIIPKQDKNKLQLYVEAQQDSLKLKQARAKDPYMNQKTGIPTIPFDPKAPYQAAGAYSAPDARGSSYEDPNEKKINDHLQKLYAALNATGSPDGASRFTIPGGASLPDISSPQTAKMEKLLALLQKKDSTPDPQLQQVNQVLDKIIQIKNPPQGNLSTPASGGAVPLLTVSTHLEETADNTTQGPVPEAPNAFFGLSDDADSTPSIQGAIEAVIHATQTVQTGSIVKLRLLQDIFIGSTRIPANNFIYGKCSIDGERVEIQLTNAICNGTIYPIKMRVFDGSDGLEGLYVPGAITRDAIKEGVGQGIDGAQVGALSMTAEGQALSAGIETAKDLISRKIRLVKVILKAGHIAILKNPESYH
jgi:conjugative transposon TraM protein